MISEHKQIRSRPHLADRCIRAVTPYNHSLSWLLDVLHKANDTTVIDGASYTYDNGANRVSKTNYLDNSAESYVYDDIYQLQQVTCNSAVSEAYTYDKVGNRLSSLGVATYSYNSSNQLTSSSDGVTYTYDNNGNTLTKADAAGLTQYGWDYENRLTSVTLPGGPAVTFKYDPFGRRIQKASVAGVSNYVYDGANITEEVDAAGMVQARYAQGPGIDEPVAMQRDGNLDFFAADGLGSVTSLTDASGAIGASYTYESFGGLLSTTGTLANPVRYTGREYDAETGMYYYRARYYDPPSGRLLSEDPDDFASDVNFYRYVFNRPTDLIDPSGRRGKKPRPPRPAPNPNAAFYICCQGGTFGVCGGPLARPSSFDNPIFNNWKLKCQKEHEQQHQEDLSAGMFSYAINPPSCVGQPNNTPVTVYLAYQARVECRGYQKQLQCLMKMESLMTPEINGVKNKLKEFKCDCGK